MATAEGPSRPHDRHSRRYPFSGWMKRLANLKNPSSDSSNSRPSAKRNGTATISKSKKGQNNPYPLSGGSQGPGTGRTNGHLSFSERARTGQASRSEPSFSESGYEQQVGAGGKSTAPTVSIDGDTTTSDAVYSKSGTSATAGGREDSTFSSPAPSVRSLTTTLTTVQSAAPSNQIYATHNLNQHNNYSNATPSLSSPSNQQTGVQFSHQFPPSPASAVPAHLVQQPTTYVTATANNLLTDNASVLTLASSSKRRRRNSLDTNASVRALAPSSLFSGSRESLPLSVLSGNAGNSNAAAGGSVAGVEPSNASALNSSAMLGRGAVAGERGSIHSVADRGSIRSGRISHHARNDSAAGSMAIPGRVSRRSSGWGEIAGEDEDEDEDQQQQQQQQQQQHGQQKPEVITTPSVDGSRESVNGKDKGKEQAE